MLPFVNNLWTTHAHRRPVQDDARAAVAARRDGAVPTAPYLQLGLSDNVSYTFDPTLPEGSRITSITIDGEPLDPAATYRIGTFSFLATGGDNFRVFTQGTDSRTPAWSTATPGSPTSRAHAAPPGIAPDFVRRSTAVTPVPTSVEPGAQLHTTLSYLDLTSLGSPANTSVDVAIGGVSLGSVPVTFTPAANGNAAPVLGLSGTAAVDLTGAGQRACRCADAQLRHPALGQDGDVPGHGHRAAGYVGAGCAGDRVAGGWGGVDGGVAGDLGDGGGRLDGPGVRRRCVVGDGGHRRHRRLVVGSRLR